MPPAHALTHAPAVLGPASRLRVVRLEDFEEPYGMSDDERLIYRRRFLTLFVDEEGARRGGLGRVARAVNAMGETFALKTLLVPERAEDEGETAHESRVERARMAFRKEYEVHRALTGFKGFPRLYGFARVDGALAIVMEWVEGVTLARARLELAVDDEGRMAPLDAARLGRDLFDLLVRLDLVGDGFVHRDISPANVMLRTTSLSLAEQAAEGAFDLCLIDFGSSVPLDPAQDPLPTGSCGMARCATAAYAAPEMLSCDLPHVARLRKEAAVDVYAAASVLFELVAGAPPFHMGGQSECSPFRVKMDKSPQPLVSAHAPGVDMAQLLPCEPEVALAVAHVMQEAGEDMDPTVVQCALARVDGQLADLVMVCLAPAQASRPSARAMREALAAFCSNYVQNVEHALRVERLVPCTASASRANSMSPRTVNRVVNSAGKAVATALLVGVAVITAVLFDGVEASWNIGVLRWEGALSAPVIAAVLVLPVLCGFAVRVFAKRSGGGCSWRVPPRGPVRFCCSEGLCAWRCVGCPRRVPERGAFPHSYSRVAAHRFGLRYRGRPCPPMSLWDPDSASCEEPVRTGAYSEPVENPAEPEEVRDVADISQ